MADKYSCFSKLAAHEVLRKDYDINSRRAEGAQVAIIAPHGGGIEPRTSEIAESIAGAEYSLYSFLGLKKPGENGDLHITSHMFDEPECLRLVAEHNWVLAIHGCDEPGKRVFLGGLDKPLINDLASALEGAGISIETTGHKYTGIKPLNICNRGARRAGVQFELSRPFRHSRQRQLFTEAVRDILARIEPVA